LLLILALLFESHVLQVANGDAVLVFHCRFAIEVLWFSS